MNWKTKVTVVGGVLGLVVGLASAMLYIHTVQNEQGDRDRVTLPRVNTTDAIPILITVIGLARTIAGLGTLRDDK